MPGSYDIGPRVGIDGEAEFKKSLNAIGSQLKSLGSEMKAVTAEFQGNEDSMEALSAKSDVLNRSIQANANQMKTLTAQYNRQVAELEKLRDVLDMATREFGENSQEAARAQNAYNQQAAAVLKLENDINKSRTTMAQYKNQLAQVERQMDGTADATDDMADALDDAGDGLGTFQVALGNLASAGIQAAISAIGNLIGSLINLDETTEEYRRAQGRLNTAFEAAGYGADTAQQAYQAFYGILGDTDTATEASQLLAQLAEREEDVAVWAEIAAGVSGTFGDSLPIEGLIEASNETAKVGKVTGVLADALNWVGISEDEFNTKLAECSSEGERNALIMNTLAGQYDEASAAFYRNNEVLVAARDAQVQMDSSLAALGQTISAIKTQLTSEFTPALSGIIEAFNGVLTGAPGAGGALAEAISGLVTQASAALPGVIAAGAQVVGAMVSGIRQSIPAILATGAELVGQLAAGVAEAVPELVASAPAAVAGFLEGITERLPEVLNQGVELINSLVAGVLETIPDMVAQLPAIITAFVDFVADNLPAILNAGIDILISLVTGIINAIPELIAQLPAIITAIVGALAENTPRIIAAGFDVLMSLVDGILSAIPELVAALPQIINAIIDGIEALMDGIIGIGRSIVQGIWQGIQDMANWITEKVTGFFSGIVDGVKDLLGIHSPSTVFAEMGGNMALGLGQGFAAEMSGIRQQISRSIQGLTLQPLDIAFSRMTAQRMQTLTANMEAAIPSAADQFGSIAAGMVNGVQTAVAGGGNYRVEIPIIINGREFSRAILPDLRAVEKSNPEVVSGV